MSALPPPLAGHVHCLHCGNPNLKIHRAQRKFCNTACRVAWHHKQHQKQAKSPRLKLEALQKKITRLTLNLDALKAEAAALKQRTEPPNP